MVETQCGAGKESGSFLFSNSSFLGEVGNNKENLFHTIRLESVFNDWQTTHVEKHSPLSQHGQTINGRMESWNGNDQVHFTKVASPDSSSVSTAHSRGKEDLPSPGIGVVPVYLPRTPSTANFPYG